MKKYIVLFLIVSIVILSCEFDNDVAPTMESSVKITNRTSAEVYAFVNGRNFSAEGKVSAGEELLIKVGIIDVDCNDYRVTIVYDGEIIYEREICVSKDNIYPIYIDYLTDQT